MVGAWRGWRWRHPWRSSRLASNENPLGPSPLAVEAIRRQLSGLNLYPNGGLDLREVLARSSI
jgi:histidinol-phosphate aminotransferase